MNPEQIIESRQSTHGSFIDNARISQTLLRVAETGKNYDSLTDVQREALHMTFHKIARLLSGNCDEDDHWNDGGNYLHLSVKFNHGK